MLVIRSEKKLQRIKLNSKHNKNILTNIQQCIYVKNMVYVVKHFVISSYVQISSLHPHLTATLNHDVLFHCLLKHRCRVHNSSYINQAVDSLTDC